LRKEAKEKKMIDAQEEEEEKSREDVEAQTLSR
jgi:hypothetical protein